ncbi:Hsp70 family protein [Phytohabitans sp. ZYX-F-186]|uniref:Hsp70 family protein n=1 Tax=Phytohabitans maris TaxID=3071409 RepID=A0ABU0ZP42_9ACTN|nr:Hsp70 family protein [Phytohabitans sp. ZYX-F-186]MDQ7908162.1 Hsp70 family protein [Phytohabitans sp. ZYX-F-186]
MGGDGYRVGIDFGTSNTAAVLAFPDGRVRPLIFDGSPLLPSAVFAEPLPAEPSAVSADPSPAEFLAADPSPSGVAPAAGGLLVGRDATHAARTRPDCFEPHPKRCVDDGTVLLGGRSVPVPELIRAVLRRVAGEAARVAGAPVSRAVLTCPVGWGTARREVLLRAARAEFAEVTLVTEPVAAATYFVAVAGGRVPVGASVMVYDLGAGTFDASVVRRTAGGFEVLAAEGLPDVGGLDIDAAVFASLGRTYGERDPAAWARLAAPADRADQRAARALWDDVRHGKEMLSRAPRTTVHVPLFDDDAPLGREEVEELAAPILERTVALSGRVLAAAGVAAAGLTGLFLVGGSSRMPLVGRLLHRHLGVAPTVVEQPELVVAEGSLHARPIAAPPGEAAPPGPDWPGEPPPPPEPVEPRRRLSPRVLAAVGLAVALLATTAAVLLHQWREPPAADLARLPPAFGDDCRRGAASDLPGATAALHCPGPTGDAVVGLFADRAAVDTAYDQAVRESGGTPGEGDCGTDGRGEHRYPDTGPARGRVLCYQEAGTATFLWTDDETATLSRAVSSTEDVPGLREAWRAWTGSPDFPTAEEGELAALVSLQGCRRAGVADLDDFAGAVAAVTCQPNAPGATEVSYFRFPSLEALRGAMDARVAVTGAGPGVDCADGKAPGFSGTRRFDLRSADLGVLSCHPGPRSTLVMEWSVEALLVAGRAVGTDAAALAGWWRGSFGPPVARIVEAVNAASTPPFPSAEERALLGHIPERTRVNCLRPSAEQRRVNVGAAPVVAAVVCGPTSGARIVFYYRFADVASMRRSYGSGDDGGKDCTRLPDGFNGESRYSRGGATGRLRCGQSENGNRYLEWTTDQLAVQAFAFQGGDPFAMIDWWRHDAGPVLTPR